MSFYGFRRGGYYRMLLGARRRLTEFILGDALLLETGDYLLLETGDKLLLETGA